MEALQICCEVRWNMTLNEKILYYRKQAKLSQEELAGQVGVSRQAVSKWELGDATPDVDKLVALARAFGVTTDELLSSQDPAAKTSQPDPAPPRSSAPRRPGSLERLIRRYGWLAGIYLALGGAGITLVGALARFAFSRMFQVTVGDYLGSVGWDSSFFPQSGMDLPAGVSSIGEVFLTIATAILVVGAVILIAGVLLAVVLYRKGRKGD